MSDNIDLSQVDLSTLNIEQLEKITMILNLSQIQQSIKESEQRILESQATVEKMRADNERIEKESQQSILQSQATVEKMRIENDKTTQEMQIAFDKLRAETEKLRAEADKSIKENRYYPILPIVLAILGSSVLSALVALLVAR